MQTVPTVGRNVYFHMNEEQPVPHHANIIAVNPEPGKEADPFTSCTLFVVHPNGTQSVQEVSVGDAGAPYPHYRWMPYQKAKAAEEAAKVPPASTKL